MLKTLRMQSSGYGFQAEAREKPAADGRSWVPMDLMERESESKAFRMKNALDVVRTLKLLCSLEWSVPGK